MTDLPDLPPGWEWTTLGEVACTSLGKMLDRARGTGKNPRPYLRNANVQWGRFDLHDILSVDIPPEQEERYCLQPGDLLVCEGGEIGRCAVWRGGHGYMAYQKALHRVRPFGGIDSRFLQYWFEYMSLSGQLVPYSTGSTIKHLPQEQLRLLPLRLPPLAEQGRIVTALDQGFSGLDAATDLLRSATTRLRALRQTTLRELLSTIGSTPQPLRYLLAEKLANGRSVPTQVGGFPVLRLTALRQGRIDLDERKAGAWTEREAAPYLVKKGDFFVSRGNGSLRLVAVGGLVDEDPDPVAFPDTLIRIRVDENQISPAYLALVWNSPATRHQIERSARTTAGIYKVNQQILERISVPLPSLADQQRIVQHIDQITADVDRASDTVGRVMIRAGQLRSSLLMAAFEGRLVAQDPNDEPAAELLARITAQRAHTPARGRARARRTSTTVPRQAPAPSHGASAGTYQEEELPL